MPELARLHWRLTRTGHTRTGHSCLAGGRTDDGWALADSEDVNGFNRRVRPLDDYLVRQAFDDAVVRLTRRRDHEHVLLCVVPLNLWPVVDWLLRQVQAHMCGSRTRNLHGPDRSGVRRTEFESLYHAIGHAVVDV